MVKLRLKRMGAKKVPFYRIVAADARSRRDGRDIDTIGTYDPTKKPAVVTIDEEKALDEIYDELSTSLIPYMPLFVKNAETAGRLDASLAKALLAKRFGCIRPQIGGEEISLTDSLHPQYAAALETRNRTFSPISITMPKGVTV